MYEQMEAGNTTMLIFYAKARKGWREAVEHHLSAKNPDGGEVVVRVGFVKAEHPDADESIVKGNGSGVTRH
jgi:hypothetical protein